MTVDKNEKKLGTINVTSDELVELKKKVAGKLVDKI
jgi:hypothetical protein